MDEKTGKQAQHEEPTPSAIPKTDDFDMQEHTKDVLVKQSHSPPSDASLSPETIHDACSSHIQLRMDGGRNAWLAVLGGWILIFHSWGLSNAFGVFQTYYSTSVIPQVSATAISWIGSIQSFLTGFTAVFGGYLIDSGRHREIMLLATFLEVFGMMMTSLGTQYWHFLLAQGICVGMGSGLFAVTSPAVLASYFKRRRLLAGGIASTGGGIAGVILPIMAQRLFAEVGFRWGVRILGFFMLALLSVALWAIRPRHTEKRFVPLQPRWLAEPVYMAFVFAFAFINAALYVPSFFIEDYAIALGIDSRMAFYMLIILNLASTAFRIFPNWIADTYGAINILLPCVTGTAIVGFCWRESHTLAGLIVVAIAWASTSASLVSLPPLGIANLVENPAEYGTRIGLAYTIAAFGSLLGNPIASAARAGTSQPSSPSAAQRQYQGTWFVAAGAALIAAILLLFTRYKLVGFRLRVKV